MKQLLIYFSFFFLTFSICHAQKEVVQKTLDVFPYQKVSEADDALKNMNGWDKANWKIFFTMLDDDSLKLKPSYAMAAYANSNANDAIKKKKATADLLFGLTFVKTYYANELIIKYIGLLGDDAAVPALTKLLNSDELVSNAARALGFIHSTASLSALNSSLKKAKDPAKQHIQAALDNANRPPVKTDINEVPSIYNGKLVVDFINPEQHLLYLQDEYAKAKNPLQKKNILWEASHIPGFSSFMFIAGSLNDVDVKKDAAPILARLALADKNIRGKVVRDALETALPLIKGEDSAVLVKKLTAHLKAMPYDNGFVSLFNGKDLTGWKALVGNPISRSKMKPEELAEAQRVANEKTKNDWIVKDGLLVFTGHGDNLVTDKMYGDMEMYVDWKITEKGDAGIYLRGSPQVQIWDTSRREVGAQVGSGGLYNNQTNQSKPLVVADNKIGSWNTFHIIMKGEKVTVFLNGVLVTENVVLENYWDRKQPIFPIEQIELQAHGTYVAYRNIYLRELPADKKFELSASEKNEGFEVLYDGTDMNKWTGNTSGYLSEENAIVVHPELSGGNVYTKDEFSDFIYRFEFQLTPGANNGIGIRAPLEGDAAYVGMEIQVLDSEADIYKNLQPYQYHGSVYGVIPAKRGFQKPTGEWNQEEIYLKGTKIIVTLNGNVIVDGDIADPAKNGTMDHKEHPGLQRTTGHIGFLGHGDVVRFRNIRIKKL